MLSSLYLASAIYPRSRTLSSPIKPSWFERTNVLLRVIKFNLDNPVPTFIILATAISLQNNLIRLYSFAAPLFTIDLNISGYISASFAYSIPAELSYFYTAVQPFNSCICALYSHLIGFKTVNFKVLNVDDARNWVCEHFAKYVN